MTVIGIMANGPIERLPHLSVYDDQIDFWIGADRGALTLIHHQIKVKYAVGDFDSINESDNNLIKAHAKFYHCYPVEKDLTDIEIALKKAFEYNPKTIYLFGVTGGRLDHELVNIQLLHTIVKKKIHGIIIDQQNIIELTTPGRHIVTKDPDYVNISFIPFSKVVKGLSLEGFYYPLVNAKITWGSTLCISNKLLSKSGTFYYEDGILLLIKSRDESSHPIHM